MEDKSLRRLSLGVLIYNLGVIVWGAYVRASGSGAGCGSHWPTCNGEIIPRAPAVKTLIEFTHRATSGLALISVALLAAAAFSTTAVREGSGTLARVRQLARARFRGTNPVEMGALASLFFMLTEAAVGAALVLFNLVEQDESSLRAVVMGVHLTNTFLLLASLALTVFWAWGGHRLRWRGQGATAWILGAALVGFVLLGISGAIAALGDTLFPAASLREGMQRDFSATAHFLLRLRFWHPVLALGMAAYVMTTAMTISWSHPSERVRRAGSILAGLFFLQLCLGVTNLVLLAPVPVQLAHLLTADLVWIALVLLVASVLEDPAPQTDPAHPTAVPIAA
jgi:heme A synthase